MSSLQETLLEFLQQREAEYEFRRQEFEELDRQINHARKFLRELGHKFEQDSECINPSSTYSDITLSQENGNSEEKSTGNESTDTSSRDITPPELVRDYIRSQQTWFSREDLAREFNKTTAWAGIQVEKFKHMLETRKAKRGRSWIYEYRYIKPAPKPVNRDNGSESRDTSMAANPVPGTGKFTVHDKEVQRIVNAARANGCSARKLSNGHIELSKNGSNVQISNSPSNPGAYNAMRRQINRVLKVRI